MEPMMISMKVLSTAAAVAVALSAIAPSVSFAQDAHRGGPAAHGGVPHGGPRVGGGGPGPRMGGGGAGPRFSGGGPNRGGDFRRGGGGGGFIPGAVAGALVGGAVAASQGGYYGGGGYYGNGPYYSGQPYGYAQPYDGGDAVVEGSPQGDDDSVNYCMQRYRSYDPASGTYMGNDGARHPCP
jgi:BA14K-like protein